MMSMRAGHLMLLATMFCLALAFAMPVHALTEKIDKDGYEFWLMDGWSLDYDEEHRTYTPTGIVEFHMPIVFRKNTLLDEKFDKKDFSYYYQYLKETSGMDSIKIQYLNNVTYYKDGKWICDKYGEKNNSEICMAGHHEQVEAWKGVWEDMPSSLDVKSGGWMAIDIIGHKKAGLEGWAVDLVPQFKSISLQEYAWWNATYGYKKRIDVDSTVGGDETVIFNVSIDTATLIGASKLDSACKGLRIVNYDETALLNFDWEGYASGTYGCNQANTIIWVQMEVSSANSSYFWLYYDDLATNVLGNSTNTYDANYVAVFHLGEGTGDTIDSVNRITGTVTGATWQNQIDDGSVTSVGHGLSFDGNDKVDFGDNFDITTSALTMELWTEKPIKASSTFEPFGKHDGSRNTYWWLIGGNAVGGGDQLSNCIVGGNDAWSSYGSTNLGWNYMSCAYNGSYVDNYVNGTFTNSVASATDPVDDDATFYIAYEAQYGTYYVGNITEIRISDVARSDDFLKLGYDLIRYSDQLVTIGSEETPGVTWINWNTNASSIPATYVVGDSNFSIRWNSTDSNGYNVSLFGTNATGSWINYTTTRVGNFSTMNITLPATTFSWQWYANNSANDWNASTVWTDTIGQASQSCSITNNESATEYYPVDVNISGTCQYGTYFLYRWDQDTGVTTNITNPDLWRPVSNATRGYRMFNYTVNTSGDANYSTASYQYNFTLNAAPNVHKMYLDGNLNSNVFINVGATLNATVVGNGTVYVYMDGVQKNSSGGVNDINTVVTYINSTLATGETYWFSSNATGGMNVSHNVTGANYSVTVQSVLSVDVLDELTEAGITFNITLSNDTFSWTEYNLAIFNANTTNMPYGDISIIVWSAGYNQRNYYDTLDNSSNETIVAYLVSGGMQVTFTIKNVLEQPLDDMEIDILRVLSDGWTVVAQGITDDTGAYPFYLDTNANYKINIYDPAGEYDTKNSTLIPSGTTYTIYMFKDIYEVPSYWQYWRDITTSCAFTNASRQLECNWTDTGTHLDNITLTVTEMNLTYTNTLCVNSSLASSGTFKCNFPAPNNMTYQWRFVGQLSSEPTEFTFSTGSYSDILQVALGLTGVFAAALIIVLSGTIGVQMGSPSMTVITTMLGVSVAYIIGLLTIPATAVIMMGGLFVAGGILVFKMR